MHKLYRVGLSTTGLLLTGLVTLIGGSALPAGASAQEVHACDWIGSAANIAEPWDKHTKTYANGNVRIIAMDTGGSPACCSWHIVVLHPAPEGYRQCTRISREGSLGWVDLSFREIVARYDAKIGLTVSVPVAAYNHTDEARPIANTVRFVVNQAEGTVTLME